jgi:acetyltransferase-like isoleucine patch superfamily enzyme
MDGQKRILRGWLRLCRTVNALRLRAIPGLRLGEHVDIHGRPIIDIRLGARVEIGNYCVLNSVNRGYHLSMFAPVKLFADKPNAEIIIGAETRIHGSCLHAYSSIQIGARCLIAANCQIFDCSGHDLSFSDVGNRINTKGNSKPIKIEDDVWIGAGAVILPGVTIGQGSVIGAGSVVTKNIPRMALAAGNPARVIKVAPPDLREEMGSISSKAILCE